MKRKRDLAKIWADAKPGVRIGKDGLEPGVIAEVSRQLKRHRVIKVRFLRAALSSGTMPDLATELAQQTGSEVWGQRGSVIILARPRK